MYVLAVTGGIGSGKSSVTRALSGMGCVALDLDMLSRRLIGPGGPLVDRVVKAFGEGVRGADGGIDHAALASIAFSSPEHVRTLNETMHPGVLTATEGAIDALAAHPKPPALIIVEIPLLVEAPGFFDIIDGVLSISSDEDTRLQRLVAGGMPEYEARARMAAQATDAERRDIADWTIENDGTLPELRHTVMRFWEAELEHRVA